MNPELIHILEEIKVEPDDKSHAFAKCISLVKFDITDSITVIDDYDFSDCSSLREINIPTSVIKICSHAFIGCSAIQKIEIPSLFHHLLYKFVLIHLMNVYQ